MTDAARRGQRAAQMTDAARRGIRAAQIGLFFNALLAAIKLVAGLVGHAYALVADAVESTADIFSSLIVWGGLAIASQPADEDHPYGHGKAEALATAVVSLMLLAAATGIVVEAVREIMTPHHAPAPWTLAILVGVMVVKWTLARRVRSLGADIGSTAVQADASHHLSDALTSAAAFIGISIALVGTYLTHAPAWAKADDWAAIFAAGVIGYNGLVMIRPALHDLMDRMPGDEIVRPVREAACRVEGVCAIEKLHVRKTGLHYRVTIHVQADPAMSLDAAHRLGGRVKYAIIQAVPRVEYVLVHMEPYEA